MKDKKILSKLIRQSSFRPMVLMLAVLYKIQERNDTFFKQAGVQVYALLTHICSDLCTYY